MAQTVSSSSHNVCGFSLKQMCLAHIAAISHTVAPLEKGLSCCDVWSDVYTCACKWNHLQVSYEAENGQTNCEMLLLCYVR